MENVTAIQSRLEALLPKAKELMKISGTPGAAIVVLHDGKLVHSEYIGFRDIKNQLPIDEATIFLCASLTKAVVSAAVAICVEEGKIGWDTPVRELLPDFSTRSEVLKIHMTPVDCLSHRAGMQNPSYWLGSMNNILVSKDNSMNIINDLEQIFPFRNQYLYNNLGYEIASHLLEKMTGASWEQILHNRIYEPLEMTRTGTHAFFNGTDNVAKTYMALDDASLVEVVPMLSGDNTVGGPGSAMRSCTHDLIKLYASFLEAIEHQSTTGSTSTPNNPIKQAPFLISSKIAMNKISLHETSYALGWARVHTPGPLGAIGLNPSLLSPKPAPNVARDHPSELILYHQGSMPGNLAAINLIPARKGAILVLTNSVGLNDTADWLGQLYLEGYLNVANRNDYIALSQESAAAALKWYTRLTTELDKNRTEGTSHKELALYAGTYYNDARTMMIKVFVDHSDGETSLKMAFKGRDDEIFTLKHYQHHEFTWLLSRNELVRKGRFINYNIKAEYFKICFGCKEHEDDVTHLTWWNDWYLPKPQKFTKDDSDDTK